MAEAMSAQNSSRRNSEKSPSRRITMIETTLMVTDLLLAEQCDSPRSLNDKKNMERTKSTASMAFLGAVDDDRPPTDSAAAVAPKKMPTTRKTTPLDFDNFLPWLCMEWESEQVVAVTRVIQEEYITVQEKSTTKSSKSSSKRGSVRMPAHPKDGSLKMSEQELSRLSISSLIDVTLPVKATYDTKSHLVEVSMTSRTEINRKTIQAINVCIPFHCLLSRLTIRWSRLNAVLMYEIAKMLPNSYLTDICLDDSRSAGGLNYDMLLDKKSPLKYLSLNRCRIKDFTCKKLAAKIEMGSPGESLLILELGSNLITDEGALAIAESLRSNRYLLHLNLSGNMITDEGTIPILSYLMNFRISSDEIHEARIRKLLYSKKKLATYDKFYKELSKRTQRLVSSKQKENIKDQKTKEKGSKKPKVKASLFHADRINSLEDEASEMTIKKIGPFSDPFDDQNIDIEDDWPYCKGNLTLCSLNLAYNNLSFTSLQKIYDVLKYQSDLLTCAGLKRILFYGNNIPNDCDLITHIESYLADAVSNSTTLTETQKSKDLKLKASRFKSVTVGVVRAP